jgi:hypothetical protein
LEEQQRREQEAKGEKPENAQKNPNDPSQRTASKDGAEPPLNMQDPKVQAWLATLPPEIREFLAGGGVEQLPPRVRKIVEDYKRSLLRQTGPGESAPR